MGYKGLYDVAMRCPMGLPTSPLYRPGAMGYKYCGNYSSCYMVESRVAVGYKLEPSSLSIEDPSAMQPSPCMSGSCCRVTEKGSHPDTGTLLGREVHRSTSVKPLSAGGSSQTLTSWTRSFGAL